jgi:hypothetical protein
VLYHALALSITGCLERSANLVMHDCIPSCANTVQGTGDGGQWLCTIPQQICLVLGTTSLVLFVQLSTDMSGLYQCCTGSSVCRSIWRFVPASTVTQAALQTACQQSAQPCNPSLGLGISLDHDTVAPGHTLQAAAWLLSDKVATALQGWACIETAEESDVLGA